MRCNGGRHEWTDEVDAERCCSPRWRREMRPRGQEQDLDPEGRRRVVIERTAIVVYGWVPVEAAAGE
jgi:hypothetical protein